MDWILSITTLLSNSGLGWFKGAWWMWIIHAINASIWIIYAIHLKEYGLILLSIVTIGVDLASMYRELNKDNLGNYYKLRNKELNR